MKRALLLFLLGAPLLMVNLDQSVLITALPTLSADLSRSTSQLSSLITANMVAMLIAMPVASWLAERFNARNILCIAILFFALGSAFCALSRDLIILLIARWLQGFGAGLMMPVARIVLQQEVPRRAMLNAIAWYAMPVILGPLLGPSLSGLLLSIGHWSLIFMVNLPIAAIGLCLTLALLPKRRGLRQGDRFDLRGYILLMGTLVGLVAALSLAAQLEASWRLFALLCAIIMLVMIIGHLYRRHAQKAVAPIIDLAVLQERSFAATFWSGIIFRLGTAALPFLCSLYLQQKAGYSAGYVGGLLSLLALGAFCAKPLAGLTMNALGYKMGLYATTLLVGLSFALAALFFSGLPQLPIAALGAILFLSGFLRSVQFTALNAICYNNLVPKQLGSATALMVMSQHLSINSGIILASLFMAISPAGLSPEITTLWIFAAMTCASALWLFALPNDAGQELATGRK